MRLSPAPPALIDSTKNGVRSSSWNFLTSSLRLADRRLAVENKAGTPERRAEQPFQRRDDLLELGEHQQLFLTAGDGLGDFAQARKFAAVVFVIGAVAQPLRGMIANLLEAHEQGQHQPPPRDPVAGLLQALLQLGDRGLIERRLLAGQMAEGLDLGLVGQIGDDALVGLEAAQDIGLHQPAQRRIGDMAAARPAS